MAPRKSRPRTPDLDETQSSTDMTQNELENTFESRFLQTTRGLATLNVGGYSLRERPVKVDEALNRVKPKVNKKAKKAVVKGRAKSADTVKKSRDEDEESDYVNVPARKKVSKKNKKRGVSAPGTHRAKDPKNWKSVGPEHVPLLSSEPDSDSELGMQQKEKKKAKNKKDKSGPSKSKK